MISEYLKFERESQESREIGLVTRVPRIRNFYIKAEKSVKIHVIANVIDEQNSKTSK